ncbi:MAG: ABC transporter substrate-binding protein [Thermodesulfobacteriota bacterium]|nr:ABC transporter substrate-binding protein [Thermodesulfobacteriota bacterium]
MLHEKMVGLVSGIAIVLAVLPTLAGHASEKRTKTDELVIGIITDTVTNYNICQSRGALLAIEEIEKRGGILGRRIKAVVEDDREGDPSTSLESCINAVEKLITADKADILIGTWRSEFALAAANTAARYKKISFVGGATSMLGDNVEKNYEKFKYFFKIHGWPNIKTSAMVWKEWIEHLMPRLETEEKPLTICLVGDTTHFSTRSMDLTAEILADAGAEVVGKIKMPFRAVDVVTELSKVRKSRASYVIVLLGGGPSSYAFARQYYDLRLPMPILGAPSPAQSEPDWLGVTDGKGRWWVCTGWFSWPPPKFNGAEEFLEGFRARWGHNPAALACGAYETIYALKAAIEKANSFETEKVIKALEEVEIAGISKPVVQWDQRHETPHPWGGGLMMQWQGHDKLVTVYPPEYASGELILKAPCEK